MDQTAGRRGAPGLRNGLDRVDEVLPRALAQEVAESAVRQPDGRKGGVAQFRPDGAEALPAIAAHGPGDGPSEPGGAGWARVEAAPSAQRTVYPDLADVRGQSGAKRALDMLFTGQTIDAVTALRDGLVSRVVAPADLDRLCLDSIARFKRPKEYRFLDQLPKSNYGKVLKTELRKLL